MPEKEMIDEIKRMWAEHLDAAFPDGCAGKEVDGICLASLDTFTARCIDTFRTRPAKAM